MGQTGKKDYFLSLSIQNTDHSEVSFHPVGKQLTSKTGSHHNLMQNKLLHFLITKEAAAL